MIYLDANATTPLLPEVLEAMLPWLRDHHSNPSGSYASAKLARKAIENAREQVAALIGAEVCNGQATLENLTRILEKLTI